MGTNALTTIKHTNGEIVTNIFKRYDGYPNSWGVLQASFLTKTKRRHSSKKELVNPFELERNQNPEYFFYEEICHLTPKMIAYFISIEKVNDISVVENSFDSGTISYFYEISLFQPELQPRFKCYDYNKNILFDGIPLDFLKASHLLQEK